MVRQISKSRGFERKPMAYRVHLLFRDFKIQFCIQISHLGIIKNHLSQNIKNEFLSENRHFEPTNNTFGIDQSYKFNLRYHCSLHNGSFWHQQLHLLVHND